uniref:ATP synthase F0 subunit 8 n=1 Tax=Parnassius acdestis TaxID=213909 RepID=UPI0023F2D9DC|nr:ATP synthase F0 subunit 8 [Parnassius acdestis]WDV10546.1 ATP synthase F0 subunit 8 [Parnassius acdestis]WEF74776.1 ATP synthase F0 subunit 8 [Parnassius acdestis]
MPQMMPINWLLSFFFFIMIFILFNIMNYYIFNIYNFKKLSYYNKKFKNMNWKW